MRKRLLLVMLVILLSLSVAWIVTAAPNSLTVDWWTIDGGGGAAAADQYTVAGTIGQFDTGPLAGGDYKLDGGYWGDSVLVTVDAKAFLPAVIR